ncbi:uncharacterized protein BDZ99DRAFT_519285 [Mytilinidion resinicola]|uniref:BTB domain-containing protein n=1 Tax=Mytilinidion resinicola TaxID=574789 RepID=A0A6A6YPV9_9PEZI|nr:uncharacterized protein BDZ99DRAFT_519285 [Mytilinidion resinicola]KAF2810589.1 hypothetical protein BDZ99DRAFT_519285 [Mytilinidion resinicola]
MSTNEDTQKVTTLVAKMEVKPSEEEELCGPCLRCTPKPDPPRSAICATEAFMEYINEAGRPNHHPCCTGDNLATFTTSKEYICRISKFFVNALKGSFREVEDRVVRLHHDDPAAFRLWVFYERNEVNTKGEVLEAEVPCAVQGKPEDNAELCSYMWDLSKAWIFGEKYQNSVSLMVHICENTHKKSPLQFYVIENICKQLDNKKYIWKDISCLYAYDGFVEELYLARKTPNFTSNEHKCGELTYVGPRDDEDYEYENGGWGPSSSDRPDYKNEKNWRCNCNHQVV